MRTRVFFAKSPMRMLEAMIGPADLLEKLKAEEYEYVATVSAESPEAVFAATQNFDVHWREGVRSMSMGDIVYQSDWFWFCSPVGFTKLQANDFTAALYHMAVMAETAG